MAVTPPSSRWDVAALRAGIGVCLVFAVPLTVLARIVGSDSGGLNALFFFGAVLGFIVGAGCAAWVQQRGTPFSHGMVTALVAYAGAQAVFITSKLVRGESVAWFGVFFTFSLVIIAGVIGGLLGSLLQARGISPSNRGPS